jgi:hypothetical protein
MLFFLTLNNVIYDILKGKDIIRVYNMHLQSIKITQMSMISENIDVINKVNRKVA